MKKTSASILLLLLSSAAPACTAAIGAPEEPGSPPPPASAPPTETPSTDAAPPVEATPPKPSPKPTRTVLLVPGTMIKGSFFDTMKARLEADGFRPFVYEPEDLLTKSLTIGAVGIGDAVKRTLAITGEPRLHVVAECNGGVATRYYLQFLGGDAYVDQVVTFVSAHHGTSLSPVGSWVTGYASLEEIRPGSSFLAKLNGVPLPKGLKLTSIYSCNDELMYPYTTSIVDGATNVLFCKHYVQHLDGFWDTVVYGRIVAALEGRGVPDSY